MTTQLSVPQNALQIKEVPAFTALCFTTRATLRTLSQHAPGVAQNLHQEASRLGLEVSGPVQWIYTGVNGDEINEFQLDIVLPVCQSGKQSGEFAYQVIPSFRCAFYTHTGAWGDFGELYNALFAQLYRDGYQSDSYVREIYSTTDFENQANCVTEIQIGLA